MTIRTYSEMIQYETFEGRFEYLKLSGGVGRETFGHDRYLNQEFYTSHEWKLARRDAIARDLGNDLGHEDHPIHAKLLVHHMNPITPLQIAHGSSDLFDLENLITTSHNTHNAIHYGSFDMLPQPLIERRPGDTILW